MTKQELRDRINDLKAKGLLKPYTFERKAGLYKGAIANFMSSDPKRNGLSEEKINLIIKGLENI